MTPVARRLPFARVVPSSRNTYVGSRDQYEEIVVWCARQACCGSLKAMQRGGGQVPHPFGDSSSRAQYSQPLSVWCSISIANFTLHVKPEHDHCTST